MLRPGNAGSNTATDHIAVIKGALAQLPGHHPGTRAGRKVMIRIDGAGSTHAVLDWMTTQRLSYSVGFSLPSNTSDLLEHIPKDVWAPAYDAHDQMRDGAWVAELTDLLHLSGWPRGVNAGRTLTPYCRLNLDPPGSVFDGYLVVLGAAGGGPARCARVR